MKKIIFILFSVIIFNSVSHATVSIEIPKLRLSPEKKSKSVFTGGDIGVSFGDYTEVRISPMIGYRFSKYISSGVKFVFRHSWNKVNENTPNETTIQTNDFGGNVFLQYNPLPTFYLKTEFSYVSYKFSTTQNTDEKKWVPFLFIGAGYTTYLSQSVFMNVGIKVDILNSEDSPFEDYNPFFDVGIGFDI